MKQTIDLVKLHRDFFLLTTRVRQIKIEETIRDFFLDCQGYSLREAIEPYPRLKTGDIPIVYAA